MNENDENAENERENACEFCRHYTPIIAPHGETERRMTVGRCDRPHDPFVFASACECCGQFEEGEVTET